MLAQQYKGMQREPQKRIDSTWHHLMGPTQITRKGDWQDDKDLHSRPSFLLFSLETFNPNKQKLICLKKPIRLKIRLSIQTERREGLHYGKNVSEHLPPIKTQQITQGKYSSARGGRKREKNIFCRQNLVTEFMETLRRNSDFQNGKQVTPSQKNMVW